MTDIPGYENIYAITRDGKVWSYPCCWVVRNGGLQVRPGLYKKPTLDNNGYYMVYLSKGKHRVSLHRLLAVTFIPNPKNLPQVNHINGIKTDNRIENLEWCTAKENIRHSHRLGLSIKGEDFWSAKLNPKKVLEIRKLYPRLSHEKIGKRYGVAKNTIGRIINKVTWKHV